ncbi:DUF7537 family lipoprotein [Halorussus aquaticus]|uniref:Uncharacterized protein n=1 Tax=Halorussus aquaticus TaxID=2953748 RepID=A0ABD5Q2Y8_9EURY|nr:hypothetical protein [Halorussus aquaticus]
MNRRSFVISAGASGVAALSGCTGRENRTSGAEGDGGTETAAEDATTTGTVDFEYPDGLSEEGVSDFERLNEQVKNNFETTDFTFEATRKSTGERNYEIDETVYYDLESEVGLVRAEATVDGTPIDVITYNSASKVYTREKRGDGVQYDSFDLSTDENRFSGRTARDTVREDLDFVDTFTYDGDGTDVRDGRAVAVFSIEGVVNEDPWMNDPSGELLVSEDAWPLAFQFEGTADGNSLRASGEFSDIGDTTVEKPDWIQQAKSS